MASAWDSLHSRLGAVSPTGGGDMEARRAREATRAMLFGRATPIAIGRHRVLRRLGAGGMGVVYAARDEELRRDVAIKVLLGAGDARARLRMRREAEALARLSDPHVVQVFEVGEQDGQVFIVMELVDGTTLAEWQRGRDADEILAMYRRTGLGLAAAHAAGLVHRDFKPDNVLVGRDDRPRVVDFGLVRAGAAAVGTDPDSGESGGSGGSGARALQSTGTEGVLGTLAYMAPEQHRGSAVDATADQFSFCVALWEALFGERPFRGRSRFALAEATARGEICRPVALGRSLARIERVLARGLSPDPARRWPSMAALLSALDPGRGRRRGRVVLAGGAVLALGGLGLAGARADAGIDCGERIDARAAEVWAEPRREVLRAAFVSAVGDRAAATWGRFSPRVDAWIDAWQVEARSACEATGGAGERVADLELDRRAACLDGALARMDALLEAFAAPDARVDTAVGAVGRVESPASCVDTVPRLEDRVDDAERLAVLSDRLVHLQAAMDAGRYGPSLAEAGQLVRDAEALGAPRLAARAQLVRGEATLLAGDPADARRELEAAFHAAERLGLDEDAAQAGLALCDLTGLRMADYPEADRWIRHVEVLVERTGTRRARLQFVRSAVAAQQGRADEGIEGMREALRLAAIDPGEGDPFYFDVVAGLGGALLSAGRADESVAASREAIALIETNLGPTHPKIVNPLSNLGAALHASGRTAEAIEALGRAVAMRVAAFGPGHVEVATIQLNLGVAQLSAGDLDGAAESLSAAVAGIAPAMGADHPLVAMARLNLATVIGQRGDRQGAEREYREALRIFDLTPRQVDPRAIAREQIGQLLLARGEPAQAQAEFEAAHAMLAEQRGPDDPLVARLRSRIGSALVQRGELTAAREHLQAARTVLETAAEADPMELGVVHGELGSVAFLEGELDQAETHLREALRRFGLAAHVDPHQVQGVEDMLGRVLSAR